MIYSKIEGVGYKDFMALCVLLCRKRTGNCDVVGGVVCKVEMVRKRRCLRKWSPGFLSVSPK